MSQVKELVTEDQGIKKLGSYYLKTFGCQMNEYDSELISWLLERDHLVQTDDEETADVAVFNTCCVRDNADQKVYGRVGKFRAYKKENPDQVLAISGCLAKKDGEAFVKRFPQVDIVVGPHNLQELPDLVARVRSGEGPFVRVDRVGDHFNLPSNPTEKHRAMVTISMGCDQWCTFCIVPYVRGQLKSRPKDLVVNEVKRLVWEGHREVLLLGQNVNDYGRDLEPKQDFAQLLLSLKDIKGLDRIRFTSPHPFYYSDDVIDAMVANKAVCEHVHMPLQSGDDEVLKRMRRRYTQAQFLELVEKMRAKIPGLSITTDIIVGFPGETEEQFQQTLEVVRRSRFSAAFMFAYSPRPGTPGALFKDQVEESVKMDRLYRLIELQNSISYEENQKLLGQTVEVMIEGVSKKDETRFTGRTRCHRLVHFEMPKESTKNAKGKFAKVELEQGYTWGFIGKFLEIERRPGVWEHDAN